MNIPVTYIVEQLRRIPAIDVLHETDRERLSLRLSRREIPLKIIARSSGYPRDVREAVWQARAKLGQDEHILLTAPAISRTSRQWLQSQGVSYIDYEGHLFVSAHGIYILRDDLDPSLRDEFRANGRDRETNIFHGKATQVLHAILTNSERQWQVTKLASEAGVAAGTALKVCAKLEEMLFMRRDGKGPQSLRTLIERTRLLDAWSNEHKLTEYSIDRYYRWDSDIPNLARAIGSAAEEQGELYAASLSLGGMYRAPFLTETDQVTLLLPQSVDLPKLVSDAKLKRVDDGANVLLLRIRNSAPFMYRNKADGLWIASDIQLFLDLNASPGRGKEQAEHLRRERLGY